MSKMAMMTRRLLERWRRTALAAALLAGGVLSANSAMSADAPLTLGVFPRFNASESTTRYSGIAEHLGQYLGRTVILVTPRDFPSFWKGVEERQYDIVQYNQYHYIRSAAAYQVEIGRAHV